MRFWVACFQTLIAEKPFYYRVFSSWGSLLSSMSREKPERHSSWDLPFQIIYVNVEQMRIENVTSRAVICSLDHTPDEDDEPASTPHF